MRDDKSDRAVRMALGLSLRAAATFAGVTKNTLALYEAAPHVVREDKAEVCRLLYREIRACLERLERLKGGDHGPATPAVRHTARSR